MPPATASAASTRREPTPWRLVRGADATPVKDDDEFGLTEAVDTGDW